jgi:hypothetical protein
LHHGTEPIEVFQVAFDVRQGAGNAGNVAVLGDDLVRRSSVRQEAINAVQGDVHLTCSGVFVRLCASDTQRLLLKLEGINMDEGNRPQDVVNEPRRERVHVLLTKTELAELDAWRRSQGISNRNEAVRILLRKGMK